VSSGTFAALLEQQIGTAARPGVLCGGDRLAKSARFGGQGQPGPLSRPSGKFILDDRGAELF
jgi:hypothetical protein